ncbi:MAG: hypothetical protein R3E14_01470 [Erythrobacter sp.]
MTIHSLAGRCVALLASASTTITLLMATQVPPALVDATKPSVAGATRFALPDDEKPCRSPHRGMANTFPCLPTPLRPAPPARS